MTGDGWNFLDKFPEVWYYITQDHKFLGVYHHFFPKRGSIIEGKDETLSGEASNPPPEDGDLKQSWYEKNKEVAKARAKAWRLAHPERFKELKRDWIRKNKKRPAQKLRPSKPLDVSPEEYDDLLSKQGGVCAICSAHPTPKRKLSVDNEYLTGRVRGLLCARCDMGIGYFKTIKLMEYAVKYMKSRTKGIEVPAPIFNG